MCKQPQRKPPKCTGAESDSTQQHGANLYALLLATERGTETARTFRNCFPIGPVQFCWPAEWPKNWFTRPGFWEHLVSFSLERTANTEFTKVLQSRPRDFTQSKFSGSAPIRWVLSLVQSTRQNYSILSGLWGVRRQISKPLTPPHPSEPHPCNMLPAKNRSCAAIFGKLRCRNSNADVVFTRSCAATNENAALQHWRKSCVARKCRFPAAFLRISSSHV